MVETVFLVFLVFLLAVFFFLTDDGQENPAPFYCASLICKSAETKPWRQRRTHCRCPHLSKHQIREEPWQG